jgi:hypothetical protein
MGMMLCSAGRWRWVAKEIAMLKREVWAIPIGMWVLCAVYAFLTAVLRAYYVDAEGVRHAALVAIGPDRTELMFWNGHAPLGMLLMWLLVKPLSYLMPVMEATQLVAAIAVALSGLVLFRLMRLTGLSAGLSGWLTFLFLTSNVALVSATMLGYAALMLLLIAIWARAAIRFLVPREAVTSDLMRMGWLSALLVGLNLFALVPAAVLGVLATLRFRAGAYWAALAAGVLVIYLGVYLAVLPAQVRIGGVERVKPPFLAWLWKGDGGSYLDPSPLSGIYWQALGEQVQNMLLPLGRPFRVRDAYQYYLGGTFITLLKAAFPVLLFLFVITLFTIRAGGERMPVERPVQALHQLAVGTLLPMLLLLLLWQGDRQALYLWTLFWAMVALSGWLASYEEGAIQRLGYALAPLVLVMAVFGLMKMSALHAPTHDSARQEVEAAAGGIRAGDILIASGRLADLLRYYTAGKALVVATEYWTAPDADLQRLMDEARRQKRRVIIWEYALQPDYYRYARSAAPSEWLAALERAQQTIKQLGGAYLRRYEKMVVYPTMYEWSGEVLTFE